MKKRDSIWLQAGYSSFAQFGKESMNVGRLAKLAGKSRSSFYHRFHDLDVFFEELCSYHLEITREFKERVSDIKVMYPDYVNILMQYKDLTFFQKQLFLLRHTDKLYSSVFEKALENTAEKTLQLWVRSAGLEHMSRSKMEPFYYLVRGTFYTRLNYDAFTPEILWKEILDINDSFKFLMDDKLDKAG